MVANHSSDEHFWFKESCKSRDNPYRNYYHWWNAEDGERRRNAGVFSMSKRTRGNLTKRRMPTICTFSASNNLTLNWENPKLRQEIYDAVRFWFEKGVDGFRMDVITFISKDLPFKELPAEYDGNFVQYYAEGPHLHEYLQEFNQAVLSKYDIMTVAEGPGTTVENVLDFVDEDRHELNMSYHFDISNLGHKDLAKKLMSPEGWSFKEFKEIFVKWDARFKDKGWGTIYLGNHDFPRMVSRWGNDSDEFREIASKMLTTFLLTMRGTPYYYFGDELGMSNIRFENVEDYRDIMTINLHKLISSEGGDIEEFMESQKLIGRDNGRTPFQWNSSENAGFTSGKPWLKINPNYTEINAEAQENDENSPLNYFRKMVKFRKENLALIYGNAEYYDLENENVFAYSRELDGKKLLILINFKETEATVDVPFDLNSVKVLFGNYDEFNGKLKPYQAVILEV